MDGRQMARQTSVTNAYRTLKVGQQKYQISSVKYSALIRFVAGYSVQYGWNYSCLGLNVLFCVQSFQCSIICIICNNFSIDRLVNLKYMESVSNN